MTRDEYIQSNISKLFYKWSNIVYLTTAFFIIALSWLDKIVTPSNFETFLKYRIFTSILFILIFFINRIQINKYLQITMLIIGTIIISSMIEIMILKFGGHESPYAIAVILTIIYVLGFMPININTCIVASIIIYGIYIIPILLYDTIINKPFFISNSIFILTIILFTLTWKYFSQKSLINELGLQYELDQEKNKLKDYSSQLEDMVKERTKELRKSETMLKSLYENANDGIVITDTEGVIIDVNKRAAELHGFDNAHMKGLNVAILELEKNRAVWDERRKRLLDGEALIFETEHYRKDGSAIAFEVSSKAITLEGETFIQSLYRDISEKKRLFSQLLHSQKMESIGTLAGGIAHDFNNILTSILGFTDLILESESPAPGIASKLRVIESSARRGSTLVSKLLSFARRGHIEPVPFDLNAVIEGTLEMLSRIIPKDIIIQNEASPSLLPAKGDVGQIEQVMMNLIINARDAMPHGGTITVKTDMSELDSESLSISAGIRKGKYIKLTLSDTGQGIPRENIGRIFEPFFTTKETGKGTGLGLAMVYGIVKEHGGYITIDSRIDEGTTFDIYIPASEKLIMHAGMEEGKESILATGKILVIDDEIPVLELIKQTLQKNGFDVIVFDNPVRGLDYFRSNSNRIDLVISDIVMPSMSGNEVIESLREINEDVKIIATTGFSETLRDIKIDAFLKKPFQSSRLLSIVKEVMVTK